MAVENGHGIRSAEIAGVTSIPSDGETPSVTARPTDVATARANLSEYHWAQRRVGILRKRWERRNLTDDGENVEEAREQRGYVIAGQRVRVGLQRGPGHCQLCGDLCDAWYCQEHAFLLLRRRREDRFYGPSDLRGEFTLASDEIDSDVVTSASRALAAVPCRRCEFVRRTGRTEVHDGPCEPSGPRRAA